MKRDLCKPLPQIFQAPFQMQLPESHDHVLPIFLGQDLHTWVCLVQCLKSLGIINSNINMTHKHTHTHVRGVKGGKGQAGRVGCCQKTKTTVWDDGCVYLKNAKNAKNAKRNVSPTQTQRLSNTTPKTNTKDKYKKTCCNLSWSSAAAL